MKSFDNVEQCREMAATSLHDDVFSDSEECHQASGPSHFCPP